MSLLKKLLEKANGLHYKQEYLCIAREEFQQPLHGYFLKGDVVEKDVTNRHLFVGYSPVIIAILPDDIPFPHKNTIEIVFSQHVLSQNEILRPKDALATLSLEKTHTANLGGQVMFFYAGVRASHRFVSKFCQAIIQYCNDRYARKQGNVFLDANLYTQVQVSYAIPRKICLITVGRDGLYNHFPTDLHGASNDHYLISLRHEGKACSQVESAKRIVLSDVGAQSYKEVYSLGKNHMQPLRSKSEFDFGTASSANFNLPLPHKLVSYRELELVGSFTHGIHKILQFKTVFQKNVEQHPATLSHIHNCYATWRYKHRISSNLLLR